MNIRDSKQIQIIQSRNAAVATVLIQLWGTDKFVPYVNSLDAGKIPVLDFISQGATYELMAEHQRLFPAKSMCIVTAVQNAGRVISSSLTKTDVWEMSGAGRIL